MLLSWGVHQKQKAKPELDTGEDLIGKSFYACVDDGGTSPAHYIITGVGDPVAYADLYNGPVPPYLHCIDIFLRFH